ncbi:hypothetical protein FSP39_003134, partial [Pinctada imbricata]
VKKCGLDSCFYCVMNPPRLSEETFRTLHWLPDPVAEDDGSAYKTFDDLYGTETTDKDRPSLKEHCSPTERDKKLKGIHTAASARAVIICSECGKRRVVYSKKRLAREELRALDVIQEQLVYTCGSQLFPGQYAETIVVKEGQNCQSPIETTYYSSVTVQFEEICFFCGDTDIYTVQDIQDLKAQYSIVRPICSGCKTAGKELARRNALKVGKKRKN